MKQILKSVFISILTVGFAIVLSKQFDQLPPVGKFFDPVIGFWSAARGDDFSRDESFAVSALKSETNIIIDKRGVPHIFSNDERDVFTAIGYMHARDRLWQMDVNYRFAAGRLSEVMGRQTLGTDIKQRRLGLFLTAQRTVAELDSGLTEFQILQAYTRGVNQFIEELSYQNYPFEFKLLNYKPEPWSIEKTVLVNVMMGYLSRSMGDLYFRALKNIFSQADLDKLYPSFSLVPYPIIPESDRDIPAKPVNLVPNQPVTNDRFRDTTINHAKGEMEIPDNEKFGSNNWVVAGKKTTTGEPILANDPHLDLTIPSVWYEAHLNCPRFDVYGVTLPGAPFVIIGFNRHIAWGMTNCGWDVTDLYQETFDNQNHDHYRYNGTWQPVEKIPQTIHIKNAPDTTIVLEYTHRGPIISHGREFFSMQWTGNQVHFDGVSVYWLNKAENYEDYRNALKFYNSPAQNFIYADVAGNIAITCAGKNPVRKNGLGRTVADGTNDRFDWIAYTPFQRLPSSLNPDQGYLASANQQPINSPKPYFGWNFPTDYRARRINNLLKNNDRIDVESMMQFQTDVYAVRAEVLVPFISGAFRSEGNNDNARLDSALFYLKNWNYEMRKGLVAPTIFDVFMRRFRFNTWQDHFAHANQRVRYPAESVLEKLTRQEPDSRWFDDIDTPEKETRDDIIRKSLVQAISQLADELGNDIANWTWDRYHHTKIPHLSGLRALGIDPFPNNGGFGTLNVGSARTNSFGPSWRMIVSLEQPIKAWGVYPGGQSGNPGSKHYLDFLETWKNEKYYELFFPEKASDLAKEMVESRITFLPGEK